MKTVEFMSLKISDLIAELTEVQGHFGDIECFVLKKDSKSNYFDMAPLDFLVMDSDDGSTALAFVDAVTASEMDGGDETDEGPGPGDTLQ